MEAGGEELDLVSAYAGTNSRGHAAANGHNTPPWKFAVREKAIEIHPDFARRLPVVDSLNREIWTSRGCALENLLMASNAAGYLAEVICPSAEDYIHVGLAADTPQNSLLLEAIPLRQITRLGYNGQPVGVGDLDQARGPRWSRV